jgi:hypothetical protein
VGRIRDGIDANDGVRVITVHCRRNGLDIVDGAEDVTRVCASDQPGLGAEQGPEILSQELGVSLCIGVSVAAGLPPFQN